MWTLVLQMGPYEHRHTGGSHLRMTAEIKVRLLGTKGGSRSYHRSHPEFILLLRRDVDGFPLGPRGQLPEPVPIAIWRSIWKD